MKAKHPTSSSPKRNPARQRVSELRIALLTLHKALVDSERVSYEKTVGQIKSPGHFLQLLATDAWFAWLQPFSQLIVAIDETLDEKEALTTAAVDVVMSQAVFLLIPAESASEFGERYVAALQRDPRVVLAHAQVAKRIGAGKPAS